MHLAIVAGWILALRVDPEKSSGPDVVKHLPGAPLEPEEKLLDRAKQLVNPKELSIRMRRGKARPRNLPAPPGRSLQHLSTSTLLIPSFHPSTIRKSHAYAS
jgi:hypothetical protein